MDPLQFGVLRIVGYHPWEAFVIEDLKMIVGFASVPNNKNAKKSKARNYSIQPSNPKTIRQPNIFVCSEIGPAQSRALGVGSFSKTIVCSLWASTVFLTHWQPYNPSPFDSNAIWAWHNLGCLQSKCRQLIASIWVPHPMHLWIYPKRNTAIYFCCIAEVCINYFLPLKLR